MTLDLKSILAGPVVQPRRVLIYGTDGIGKSSWASQAPNPIFLPTEDGLAGIKGARFPLLKSFDEVMDSIRVLYEEDHKHETVILDSLDWTEKLIWTKVCESQGKASIEDCGYGRGYVFALEYWHQLLDGLSALRDKNMTVVMIAHAGIEKIENPLGDNYDKFAPRLHKKASAVICEWVDECLFASYRLYVKKANSTDKKGKALGDGERIIHTVERPAYKAKNRLDLPEELPLIWDEYAKFLPGVKKEVAGKSEKNGKEKKHG